MEEAIDGFIIHMYKIYNRNCRQLDVAAMMLCQRRNNANHNILFKTCHT